MLDYLSVDRSLSKRRPSFALGTFVPHIPTVLSKLRPSFALGTFVPHIPTVLL